MFILSKYIYQLGFVSGISMAPTLNDKEIILIKKFKINVNRNDIVLIKKNNKTIIKRVIGTPGDELKIIDGYLFVNNKKYENDIFNYSGNLENAIELSKNEYFVLGDNRNNSIDSRYDEIGIIKKNEIKGIIRRR